MPLSDKNAPSWAVVTGASGGIGRAAALALADDGWNVVAHFSKSRGRADAVREEVKSRGRACFLLGADLSYSHGASSFVEEVWKLTGGVDAWVHVAGADVLTGSAAKLSYEEKLDQLARVDLIGTVVACHVVGEKMRQQRRGVILTVGWDQSAQGMEGDSGELFAAVKGGIAAFTRSLAKSLAPEVRVNCVAPGWIRTAWGESASQAWQERVMRETPLGRWGTPDDVARTIAFLASSRAEFLTGQTINVNGGVVTS